MSSRGQTLALAAAAAAAAAVVAISLYLYTRKVDAGPAAAAAAAAAAATTATTSGSVENAESEKEKAGKSKAKQGVLSLPVVDFRLFFQRAEEAKKAVGVSAATEAAFRAECSKVSDAFHKYGVVVLRDPRVEESDNNTFLDMMERYFGLSDGFRDARPKFAYQVGVTPEHTERPRDHCATMGTLGPDDKPLSPCPPELDPKWRFFWRIGQLPEKTNFPALNADAVIPPEFPEWKENMDKWGGKMMDALFVLAEMAAIGFDMEPDAFVKRMKFGPHLLAPTGSDFNKFNTVGTVLAGYHYDLNFLTIHGKSRFPGLNIWTREGKKMSVEIPDGCLLVQAGKQIEYLTGGHVLAGFHEVVINANTKQVIDAREKEGKSLWRVSSTCFGHIQSDQELKPLAPFNTPEANAKFQPKFAGQQVTDELILINLDQSGRQGPPPSHSPDDP